MSNDYEQDVDNIMREAAIQGIKLNRLELQDCFGYGTYRWLIGRLGLSYEEGMNVGIFELHQNYDRETTGLPPNPLQEEGK